MGIVSSGFMGRRKRDVPGLPPGQYLTEDFPVLSAGPTPRIERDQWVFSFAADGSSRHWDWNGFMSLPQEDILADLHCVTSWSKLGTRWRGVPVDALFEGVETDAEYALFHSYGGYTTNLPLDDVLGGKAWIVHEYDGGEIPPEHGGPARLLVPHLYLWKSAKWVSGLELMAEDEPGFWESRGYHLHGDPWREERYG
ncbi:molybdopterin-dependent oxidoreductase [Sinomonas sp. ASV322]|uniref:molybdopterin-dependent oxidoreductase n=1 Tax=Sinomonas sp. ASV322 TaxID=3041920 RepID=UPI0027DCD850|nr:molybdopterin-dependent oxidoreductase [Sinomonas sp. ASV322]MDQ4501503.1 molybdopterin-dependent oxidoreductase [Sinomonas sp. ASV322]